MTDRELLELAAKAGGMKLMQFADGWQWANSGPRGAGIYKIDPNQSPVGNPRFRFLYWNPLTDDGDALRLSSDVGINISYHSNLVDSTAGLIVAQSSGFPGITVKQQSSHNKSERQESTRRSIVRCAAEIVKSMA